MPLKSLPIQPAGRPSQAGRQGPARPDALLTPGDSVRDVLARFPATAAVFGRHGLMGCGGAEGPDEPIGLFAEAHRVPLQQLLVELDDAARAGVEPAAGVPAHAASRAGSAGLPMAGAPTPGARGFLPIAGPGPAGAGARRGLPVAPTGPASGPSPAAEDPTARFFARHLRAALWLTFSLGASLGALNLLLTHWALATVSEASTHIHAGFQVFGFVLLFIVGVAFHAVPRFLGARLAAFGAARAVLPLLVGGLLLRSLALCLPELSLAPAVLALGSLATAAGVGLFAFALARTRATSSAAREAWQRWLEAGTLWWVAGALAVLAGGADALLAGDVARDARWHEAAWRAGLFGGAFCWIAGMLERVGPVFLGSAPIPPARSRALRRAAQLACAAAVGGALAEGPGGVAGARWVALAGVSAFALVAAAFAFGSGVLARTLAPRGGELVAPFVRGMRLAFAFLPLFAALVLLHAALSLGPGSSNLIYDAARHAFALGFVALTILAMAGRIVPIFAGSKLGLERWRDAGAVAIAAGAGVRALEVPASLAWPGLLWASGVSGLLALFGVGVLGAGVLKALSAKPEAAPRRAGPAPLAASTTVADLIDSYPPALAILLKHGFAPLANPIARRTLARAVTLELACRNHGKDAAAILDEIRSAVKG